MAHMTINSTNPKLSWVLCKNPATGLVVRKIRKGFGFGWFSNSTVGITNEQEYNLMFREDHDSDSFSENGFAYLSQAEYTSAFAYNCLITTLLRDVVKGESEHDVEAMQAVTLHQVGFKGYKLLEQIQQFIGCEVIIDEVQPMVFTIVFREKGTLHSIISKVLLACLFLGGDHGARLTKLDESFMDKYANLVNKLNLPYFLRYVFARNFFRDSKTFQKMAIKLETENIKLAHGDTAMQRLRFIEKQIDHTKPILDVGCGAGLYALNLTKRNPFTYHAVDIDEDLADMVQRKGNSRGYDIQTYTHLSQYQSQQTVDIIFTEVIEHMPLVDAELLLRRLLNMNFNKLIVTTPDRDFNVNYCLGDEFRHDDHDWEMNKDEFTRWFTGILGKEVIEHNLDLEFEWVGIGDCVDGVYTSQGFIVKNRQVQKEVVITVGAPASGKSTYARNLVNAGWSELNRDDIRFRNGVKDWSKYTFNSRTEGAVHKKWEKKLWNMMHNNENIVISDTNLNKERTLALKSKLESEGYLVTIKEFDVPFSELIERDTHRQGSVGYEVLLKMYIQYMREWKGIEVYQPNDQSDCYVVDLDGTIAHNADRSIYDESKVDTDTPIMSVLTIVKSLIEAGVKVVFLSGRQGTEDCLLKTRTWLVEHIGVGANDCPLIMRTPEDTRKDSVVKMEMFDKYVRNKYNVLACIDDRKQVIEECWSVLGVKVISVGNPIERF